MKPTIDLKPVIHKNAAQLGIYFNNDPALNFIIRKEADGTWSQSKKCWYIPLDRKAFEKLKAGLNDHALLVTELTNLLKTLKK